MGQQQLLLIILGALIVGITIIVGMVTFEDSALSSNKEAVAQDLIMLASKAKQYYRKPMAFGGGGRSFAGIDSIGDLMSSGYANSDSGKYFDLTPGVNRIILRGYVKTRSADGTYPRIELFVTATGYTFFPWSNVATILP